MLNPIPVPSSSQPKKTQKYRKTKRKATEISQFSRPTTIVADEIVHKEKGDSMERAATTASSLEAKQDSDTILRDRPAQARFERLSKQSNDPPLSRVNTLGSGEDSMKLHELIEICTKLSKRVLALENIKTAQALEITHLKKSVKKLEKKKKSRTPQLKRRLFKGKNELDQDEGVSFVQEDAETQERYGHDIEVNTASTSVTTASINITSPEPATTASALITTTGVSVSTAEPSTPPPTTTTILIDDEDLTIAQTLMKMRSVKSKEKSKEKRVTKPKKPVKVKGKDQITYDPEVAQKLHEEWQAELEEQDRLAREKEEKALVEE
ncbi:hypothetical protein Tco_0045709 [Tanacetum coccineum]